MDAPRKFTGCCAVEATEVTHTYYHKLQILQILVTWTALSLILQRDITVNITTCFCWLRQGRPQRKRHFIGHILENLVRWRMHPHQRWEIGGMRDWVVTPIWGVVVTGILKCFEGNSLFQIIKSCYNQLWKVWPFCCCQSAKFLTPTALLLKALRLEGSIRHETTSSEASHDLAEAHFAATWLRKLGFWVSKGSL